MYSIELKEIEETQIFYRVDSIGTVGSSPMRVITAPERSMKYYLRLSSERIASRNPSHTEEWPHQHLRS